MQKMTGQTADIAAENVAKIRVLFPTCVDAQGNIDFPALKTTLGVPVDSDKDSAANYSFVWSGKEKGRAYALAPSAGTLRPDRSKSVDFDTTKNIYIEGDNLEVLKLLRGSYANRVKMIYIDPPYNTGNDFVYNDDYSDSIESYKKLVGLVANDGTKLKTNADTAGRYHTNWLNMMFPRLLLARDLLSDDGAIFISIDDHEYANLRKICDEVFGENNFIATFIWTKTSTPPALSPKCRKTVEYVVVYEKTKTTKKYFGSLLDNGDAPLLNTGNPTRTLTFPEGKVYFRYSSDGVVCAQQFERCKLLDDVVVENGVNKGKFRLVGEFKWDQTMLNEEVAKGTYFLIKSDAYAIRFQRKDDDEKCKTPTNFIELNKTTGVGTNESATTELENLGMKGVFDYPKPTSLLKKLISMICYDSDEQTVVDFFSGSGSFAHAVMSWNRENKKNTQYILVQLPENLDDALRSADASSKKTIEEAIKFCRVNNLPHTLCSIGEERIRLAAAKIKAEYPDYKGDLGFKVFTLDSSNVIPWNPDPSKLDLTMRDMEKNLVAGRENEDLLFEILLKKNVPLDVDIESFEVETEENGAKTKNTVYVAGGVLFVCLDQHIPGEVSSEILKLRDKLAPETDIQVVFRETGFCDVDKTNALAILEQGGVDGGQIWTL